MSEQNHCLVNEFDKSIKCFHITQCQQLVCLSFFLFAHGFNATGLNTAIRATNTAARTRRPHTASEEREAMPQFDVFMK